MVVTWRGRGLLHILTWITNMFTLMWPGRLGRVIAFGIQYQVGRWKLTDVWYEHVACIFNVEETSLHNRCCGEIIIWTSVGRQWYSDSLWICKIWIRFDIYMDRTTILFAFISVVYNMKEIGKGVSDHCRESEIRKSNIQYFRIFVNDL
jgi:hypothetical protein